MKLLKNPRILFLPSHLSTGGMPAFLLKRIEVLQKYTNAKIFVVEYQCVSLEFTVQRNTIKLLLGDNFQTLNENKMQLFDIIKSWHPDIIHIDEMSERLDYQMTSRLYDINRSYKIVETCHDISFNPQDKIFHPDIYMFCTPYHLTTFANLPGLKSILQFPIDEVNNGTLTKLRAKEILGMEPSMKHVLNVGLWTKGKNQEEGLRIARLYPNIKFHFVGNQANNFIDYWKSLMKNLPKNVKIWGERTDVAMFMKAADIFMFNSTWECNPLVLREAISNHLPIIARDLPQYGNMFKKYINPITSDLNLIKADYEVPIDNTSEDWAINHVDCYNFIVNNTISIAPTPKISITQHFVDNPFLEILGNSDKDYTVKFLDSDNVCYYENTIKSNHWIKLNRTWFTKWTTEIWSENKLLYKNTLDYTGKRVYIAFNSKALGDTIAWIPYVLKFQEIHNCHVIVSTFNNALFKKVYPELEFINPGEIVYDIYGMYNVGYFYNNDKEPTFPNSVPLQKAACNILGLAYEELIPRINFTPKKRLYKYKYVTIATNSTSGCKYWNKVDWQKLVNYIIERGYKVINVSIEKNPLDYVEQIEDTSIENTMHTIYHSELFIGLSSGLSWLAWALKKHVVMIANFTGDNYEFQSNCTRIINKSVCHDCWSTNRLDAGDWNWCPLYKNTPRQWECQKSINANMVIDKLKELL